MGLPDRESTEPRLLTLAGHSRTRPQSQTGAALALLSASQRRPRGGLWNMGVSMTGCIPGRGWVAAVLLTAILTSISVWSGASARADAPVEAGAVVRRLMETLQTNDRAAFLDVL